MAKAQMHSYTVTNKDTKATFTVEAETHGFACRQVIEDWEAKGARAGVVRRTQFGSEVRVWRTGAAATRLWVAANYYGRGVAY
jgi:hypothetical protein